MTEIYFIIVLEAGSPGSRYELTRFLVRALFLAYRWLHSLCVLTWLHLFVHVERKISGVSCSSY